MDRPNSESARPAKRGSPEGAPREAVRPKRAGVVTRRVPAVSRAVAILRLLGKSEAPVGVHAVAKSLGLIPSTCLHILRVLVDEELVAFDVATKRYALAAGILSIARGVLRQRSLNDVAQPLLDGLARRWGATAVCVETVGLEHIVVVAISRIEQALRVRVELGSRFPALISATGRCVAAFGNHPPEEISRHFRALRWDNPPNVKTWRDEVEATRAIGYAIDDGRYISGVAIAAAPVPSPSGVKNVLVIIGVSEQLRRAGYAAVGEDLRARAIELSERLEGG